MNKYWYPLITRRWGKEDIVFLNWGYEEDPPLGLPLAPEDEPNRYCIQLYHRTATQADLGGKQVLEVSSGHGGGAAYLVRTFHPASYTGLDYNPDGVAFAQKRHHLPGLEFVHGNAESMPFPDESFDAVINVEASHAYPHFERFLPEMARVLRPEGISSTPISAGSSNMPSGMQHWPPCRCGWCRSGRSTRRFCAGWTRTRRGTRS